MVRQSFDQVRALILYNETLHKIVDDVNYGIDIGKRCSLLESECRQTRKKSKCVLNGGN
jgi:hypothetical protein